MTLPPVQCIDCAHFDMRKYAAMAREGYGTCGLDHRTGRFQSAVFPRTCPGFVAAPAAAVAKRRQWLAEQRENFRKSIIGETA
ncbi:MAG TPA: hypothetical protein VN541_05715 [Tepidisphaeraceae bacterium]|nr:hypothetical protein [Tepidisphaeraceae bacterium]